MKKIREIRHAWGIRPVFKTVDTCAAEFEATTPYHYSSYDEEDEMQPSDREKVIILGSGPNRIGQGIEFDYSCVHAALALSDAGFETIMINCNPETVSTDYDTSDRLYFEPLTCEDVLEVVNAEQRQGAVVASSCNSVAKHHSDSPNALKMPASRLWAPRRPPSISPKNEEPSAACWRMLDCRLQSTERRGRSTRQRPSQLASVIPCLFARVMCSAGEGWRLCTTMRCSRVTCSGPLR